MTRISLKKSTRYSKTDSGYLYCTPTHQTEHDPLQTQQESLEIEGKSLWERWIYLKA